MHTTTTNATGDDDTTSHGTNNTNTQGDNDNKNKYEHQSALTKLPTPPNNDVWMKWATDKSFWETHEDEYARQHSDTIAAARTAFAAAANSVRW